MKKQNYHDNSKKEKKNKTKRIKEILELLSIDSNDYINEEKNEQESKIKNLKDKRFKLLYEKKYSKAAQNNGNKFTISKGVDSDYIDQVFKSNFNIKYKSNIFIEYIKEKKIIDKELFDIIDVPGDGNCFYYAISKFLFATILYHNILRKAIASYCSNNINEIINFQPNVEIRKNVFISTEEYIKKMAIDKNWAIDIDILICAHIFGINIGVYKYEDNQDYIEFLYSIFSDEKNELIPVLILLNENENHFKLINPKNNISQKTLLYYIIIT